MNEASTPPVIVYGAGDHGLVVAEAASLAGRRVLGFLDDNLAEGASVGGYPVLAGRRNMSDFDAEFIVAVGDNDKRFELTNHLLADRTPLATIIHPGAHVSPSARIAGGSFIGPGAVVNPRASIDRGVIVNSAAVIEHDCEIEAAVHIAPGAVLTGRIFVGMRTLIGARAVVLPGRVIGDGVTIGAGAVVIRDVAAGQRVAGVPARVLDSV